MLTPAQRYAKPGLSGRAACHTAFYDVPQREAL